MKWKRITDTEPECGDLILAMSGNVVETAVRSKFRDGAERWYGIDNPTHWLPIPSSEEVEE